MVPTDRPGQRLWFRRQGTSEFDKLVLEKVGKGYEEVGAEKSTAAPVAAPPKQRMLWYNQPKLQQSKHAAKRHASRTTKAMTQTRTTMKSAANHTEISGASNSQRVIRANSGRLL